MDDGLCSPGPYPLRPEIVDFAFAPPHGWGALSLILLGREGDVYTMCPFTPWQGPGPSTCHPFYSLIRSFVHVSLVSFAHSLIRSFAHSLIRST